MHHVKKNYCNCHPETCGCNPWVIVSEDGEIFSTEYSRVTADRIAALLNKKEEAQSIQIDELTKQIKKLKKQYKKLKKEQLERS